MNAVYFFGNWAKKFKPEATYKGDFKLNSKATVKTDFMNQTSHFEFAEHSELNITILKLPYAVSFFNEIYFI